MKNRFKKQKTTLLKSPVFSAVVVAAIINLVINLFLIIGLFFVMSSPKYDIYSRTTISAMGVVSGVNIVVIALLLILRKYYERRAYKQIIIPLQYSY